MKITEAWANRKAVIEACKAARACSDEFKRLKRARTQTTFENVLYNNFSWCVRYGILEEWLPDVIENATTVDAPGCSELTTLNAPNATKVNAWECSKLTTLNAPNATFVNASYCSKLTTLNAPNATTVYAGGCSELTTLNAPNATEVIAWGCRNLTTLNAPNARIYR